MTASGARATMIDSNLDHNSGEVTGETQRQQQLSLSYEASPNNLRDSEIYLRSSLDLAEDRSSTPNESYPGDSDEEEKDGHSMRRVATWSKDYTAEEEKAIVRKFDRRLVLFMGLLYLLSFLDRSNIGNARIAGLESSLALLPGQYAWLLTAFYMTYIAFEWMTLLYQAIPPHIYISICVLSWGLIASLQSVSTSFESLVVFRALLGISEAAFGPGVPFYLSFFYRRSELAYRVGLFISAAPLASSCASSLAWLIVKLSRDGPLEPWRALFLVEGFPSIIVAAIAWHIIPDSPSTARYLTARERKVAKLRLQAEETQTSRVQTQHGSHGISLTDILTTLRDPKCYLTSMMFFSANIAFSSLPVFLPTILSSATSENHPSALQSQLLSAPPYLSAFAFVLLTSHLSDAIPNTRSTFIILSSLLSSISYALIALAGHLHSTLGPRATFVIRYAGVFGAAMGFFSAVTLIITWTINNQSSATGKGTGVALLNVIGQCGPLLGTHLYPEEDGPFYVSGMVTCAAFMLGTAGLAAGLRWWLEKLNRLAACEDMEMDELGREGEGHGVREGLIGRSERKRFRQDKSIYIL